MFVELFCWLFLKLLFISNYNFRLQNTHILIYTGFCMQTFGCHYISCKLRKKFGIAHHFIVS